MGLAKHERRDSVARVERRLFHIVSGSLFPLAAIVVPESIIIGIAAGGLAFSIVLEVTRLRSEAVNRWFIRRFSVLLKESESSQILGSTYLLIAILAAFLLFDKYIAILALLYLAIGDPLAALVGERYGRVRFRKKSGEGSLAFLLASISVGWLLVAGGVDLSISAIMVGAATAAFIELLSIPPDDNLAVPLVAGGVMTALA